MFSTNRKRSLSRIAALCALLLGLNTLVNVLPLHVQFDVTGDKRYSLTKPTKAMLGRLTDDVNIETYLTGEFPAGFKRLQTVLRDLLNDMHGQSAHLHFAFIDPSEGSSEKVNEMRATLKKDGILPVNLTVKGAEKSEEKFIFPYAKVLYHGHTTVVNLLENQTAGLPQEVILNNSASLLEYKLANAISKLEATATPVIAFVEGHGELLPIETADLEKSLDQYYVTTHLNLDSVVQIKPQIKCLLINRPRTEFSEKDKFKLDQYIMNGGRVVFTIDKLNASTDSLRTAKRFAPNSYETGLDAQLFKYGVRINADVLLDMRCTRIPVQVGVQGNQPQFDLKPWYYHVLTFPDAPHPIVKNLDGIQLYYPSTIDTTIKTKLPLKRTILLTSSQYSRMQYPPFEVSFDLLRSQPKPQDFPKSNQPIAVLLEGKFSSYFENRVTPDMQKGLETLGMNFKNEGQATKIVVIADGDVARNTVNMQQGSYKPLGLNDYEKYVFANKSLMLNVIEYLLDNNGVMEARGKEIKLRMLDKTKAHTEKTMWQILNVILPLLLLGIFAIIFLYYRKKKYA
jgi:ABC-2 type transport system permease protein